MKEDRGEIQAIIRDASRVAPLELRLSPAGSFSRARKERKKSRRDYHSVVTMYAETTNGSDRKTITVLSLSRATGQRETIVTKRQRDR